VPHQALADKEGVDPDRLKAGDVGRSRDAALADRYAAGRDMQR
jgi:hypothetical protein